MILMGSTPGHAPLLGRAPCRHHRPPWVFPSRDFPVLNAVVADRIGRREHLKEMGIQDLRAAPDAAYAEKGRGRAAPDRATPRRPRRLRRTARRPRPAPRCRFRPRSGMTLARAIAADIRLPWQRPQAGPGQARELTPGRARAGFRHVREALGTPASAGKPATPAPAAPQARRTSARHPAIPSARPPSKTPALGPVPGLHLAGDHGWL